MKHSGHILSQKALAGSKSRPQKNTKRVMDILLCVISLPVIMPLCILLALYICLDGQGAPIYRQVRVGKDGKAFLLFKFRTMVRNADKLLETCLEKDPELAKEWRENQKLKDDPRLTRAGRFLRKTSLDELPQIINILQGDMSIVGPRPIIAEEKERYGRYFKEYCEVLPGLTGLWQTSGRNNTTYAQRIAYDHYYINNWSLWLDLWIIARTVPVTFKGYGAY